MPRTIVHADLDAFFASVEQRDDPALAGRPVVVGGSPEQRGVVAAASYEARRFGIRSAMPMRTALRLCPAAVRVPPRFDAYATASADVMAHFRGLTELVEPLSLDEAFLDISDSCATWDESVDLATQLKRDVRAGTGLTLSVGIATSKSVAKIASDLRKPDGLVAVPPGQERTFLASLPVGRLWGVGPKGEERLARLGVQTIGQLADLDASTLTQPFGHWGEQLLSLARGIDDRPVTIDRERKSVGRETTFAMDIRARSDLDRCLDGLCAEVALRLERRSLRGKTVTLKVRRADFSTCTRQATLPVLVHVGSDIRRIAARLLDAELRSGDRVRLLGVSVSGFAELAQLPLFPLE
ncbi:MAG: DNA polymerase IV [Dehalococcoidia bacterium]